ncbi:hypothetical protein MPSEU_001022700 [Mayamaea pseudoterrestris]|nr:hypothetical protein MPSEU_001022700 [Mayamaea pseudoterrestris]
MTSSQSSGWVGVACFKLVLLFVLSLLSKTFSIPSSPSQTFHRCRTLSRNETSTSLLEDLQQSQCQPCDFDLAAAMSSVTDLSWSSTILWPSSSSHQSISLLNMHVVVLLTSQQSFEKCMVTTSGLLTRGIRVTMLSAPNMPSESAIRPALAQHMPCHLQVTAQSLLTFRTIYYNTQSLPCNLYNGGGGGDYRYSLQSSGDVIYCSILNAAPLVRSMSETLALLDEPPTVLLMDATSVAGLLMAEQFLIPSLMIVEQTAILRHVLGDPLVRSTSSLQHGLTGYHWMLWLHPVYWYRLLQDRLTSLNLTSAFIALNRVRQTLGLQRLRTVADLWRAPGCLLWSSMPDAKQWQALQRNLLVYSGPFLPPCVPCEADLASSHRMEDQLDVQLNKSFTPFGSSDNVTHESNALVSSVIVSAAFRDDELGRRQLRSLLNGLVLAREWIQDINEKCPINNSSLDCWRGPQDFRIILTGPRINDFLLPPFVSNVESAFLDVLSTFKPTAALVSLCDPGNTWTRTLGPPVLCLDLRWSPDELARHLLDLLQHHLTYQLDSPQQIENDVLHKIIHVLEDLSEVKVHEGDNWSSGWEMGVDVMDQLDLAPFGYIDPADALKKRVSDRRLATWLIYPAYAVVGFASLYLVTKNWMQAIMSATPRQRTRRHARVLFASAAYGLLARLPELDTAWTMWLAWVQDVSNQMAESSANGLSPKQSSEMIGKQLNGSGSVENGHSRRRYKSSRKRS